MKLASLTRVGTLLAVAALALGAGVGLTHAQDQPLGGFHMWISVGQQSFHDDVEEFWGVSDDTFLALEGYGSIGGRHYVGGRVGYLGVGEVDGEGFTITDFSFLSGEVNYKYAIDLGHGFVFDVGGGGALLWIDWVESDAFFEGSLNDAGFGYQAFFDFTWRARHFLAGLDARYQRAFDIVDLNTSSFSAGAHVGIVF